MRASLAWELVIQLSPFLKSLLMLWLMLQLGWQPVTGTAGKPCCTFTVCLAFLASVASSMTRQLALPLESHLLVLLFESYL